MTPPEVSALLHRAAVLLRAVVVRRDYSAGAWRVEYDGRVLSTKEAYPGHVEGDPLPPIDVPVCADTRREAVERLVALREETARQLMALVVRS